MTNNQEEIRREEIGKQLQQQLEKGYDVLRISKWAYDLFFNHVRELSSEMDEVLQYLFLVEEGPIKQGLSWNRLISLQRN